MGYLFPFMLVAFTYRPDIGFHYTDIPLPWGSTRQYVREVLAGEYKCEDQEFSGIASRRDIYQVLSGQSVLLILHYDSLDQLAEFEINQGVQLNVDNVRLNIGMPFQEAVDVLYQISSDNQIIDREEVLFADLKISVCSGLQINGDEEDNQLSYIYCSIDISHLLS